MYTVFAEDGQPKMGIFGPVFVRTLSEALKHVEPGEKIVHWTSSGGVKTTWLCQPNGKIHLVPKAR
jgi:hypothetical protein